MNLLPRLVLMLFSLVFMHPLFSCTVILNNHDERAVVVGRNMDWYQVMPSQWWVYPAGILRNGGVTENPLQWTSKYGSVVTTSFAIATDGLNEKGLSAHLNWLNNSDYGTRDVSQPGLLVTMWAQYYLDNFQTVDEAVKFTQSSAFQLVGYFNTNSQRWLNIHMAIEDATGDSAIIEYIDGTPHVYHDRANVAMTNDPTYDQQLLNIKQYKPFGGTLPLPGTMSPVDRFVRAVYFDSMLPTSNSMQHLIAEEFSVLQSASQPYTLPTDQNPHGSTTIWHTVSDLTNKQYYYQSTFNLNLMSMSLLKFNLRPGAPVMMLSLDDNENLAGDVTQLFKPVNQDLNTMRSVKKSIAIK